MSSSQKSTGQINQESAVNEEKQQEPIRFPDSVKYGEKSLVGYGIKSTVGKHSDTVYQIINLGDKYLFYLIKDGNYITDFENLPEIAADDENNFMLNKKAVLAAVTWVKCRDDNNSIVEQAAVKFNWSILNKNRKTEYHAFYISLADEISFDMLKAFFDGVKKFKVKAYEDFERTKFSQKEDTALAWLTLLCLILTGASVILSIIALFPGLRNLSVWIGIIPFVLFTFYFLFPKYFTITDIISKYNYEKGIDKRFSMFFPVIICTFLSFLFGFLYEYTLINTSKYIFISALLTAVCTILLLIRSTDCRKSLRACLIFVCFIAAASFSGVQIINSRCDSNMTSYTTVVEGKFIVGHRKGSDDHFIKTEKYVDKIKLGREYYDQIDIGDEVTVNEYEGALGISFVKIEEKNQ